MSTSRKKKPTQLKLSINDLDFYYLPTRISLPGVRHSDLHCTIDCSWFFSNGGAHMGFVLDCEGGQGSYNPHCGPIYRHGENLWSEGRGFIFFSDGTIMAERWNGTAMPGLVTVANTSGATYNPVTHPVITVHIQAGYRVGAFADRMRMVIHQGITVDGPVLFEGEVSGAGWGWDWTGTHKAAIAGIGPHFVTPNDTGCVEERVPRDAPNAALPFTNFKLRLAPG
ncbi:hypothetical protein KW843_07785 [Acidovorax sp. sif1233]|uniref:hypothetical protein n=1 Tax=unclassified Acidovorax TaxID=2684926 RepID=UPI001C464F32|nr:MULTISPECIES: hypothetical protein [unclassified Acidovorax]MBV7429889.1 hypothetical protein [Acidovorax sp. sif0732]MBV7451282.1 hypothetical protein [Acidovorax sp. sif0715]MBV7454364.1 hypothetical protein [Acidovorax sp. sif1233]